MSLSTGMEKSLNQHINDEFYAAYLYLAMSAYFDKQNLPGFSNWMKTQAQEEVGHGMKYFNFITSRGGRVELEAVKKPACEWYSPDAAIEDALNHERKVTKGIHELVTMARNEKDHATDAFLQWFVTEQVEEEETVDSILQQLKLVANAPGGLFLIDREMAGRATTPATN